MNNSRNTLDDGRKKVFVQRSDSFIEILLQDSADQSSANWCLQIIVDKPLRVGNEKKQMKYQKELSYKRRCTSSE